MDPTGFSASASTRGYRIRPDYDEVLLVRRILKSERQVCRHAGKACAILRLVIPDRFRRIYRTVPLRNTKRRITDFGVAYERSPDNYCYLEPEKTCSRWGRLKRMWSHACVRNTACLCRSRFSAIDSSFCVFLGRARDGAFRNDAPLSELSQISIQIC